MIRMELDFKAPSLRAGRTATVAAMALTLGACIAPSRTMGAAEYGATPVQQTDDGWLSYGGHASQDHYSSLSQINRENVKKLKIAWTFDTGEKGSLETTPVIVGRVLYTYTPSLKVVALDAASGKLLWTFDSGVHEPDASRGVSYWTLIPWPEGLPAAAAVFTEPLANAINAMRQAPNARRSRVVVIGAGPIGLMCLFAAKRLYQSSVVISDRVPERLGAALMLGADLTVHAFHQDLATETVKYWAGERAEFVVDAVGSSETKLLSLNLVEPRGAVVWVGLHEDRIELNSYALTLGQKACRVPILGRWMI